MTSTKVYLTKVSPHNPSQRTDREWHLPHHAVVNPHKPGEERRVLNGASKFHGCSLNNCLLTGPDLLQSLLHVLFRFREHRYAVFADIEAMFMQVGVLPEDQRSLRFLWRKDPTRMWRFINTPDTFSAPKIPRHVLILPYKRPLPITKKRFLPQPWQ